MAYLQVVVLFVGCCMALGYCASNHNNRTRVGVTHYAWFHPRFLSLATTVATTGWLVLWPLIAAFATNPLRVMLTCLVAGGLLWWLWSKLSVLRRVGLGTVLLLAASLAVGGMPPDMSLTANLAILNIIPMFIIFHRKGDDRLRDILKRYDVIVAYGFWIGGHALSYGSLAMGGAKIARPSAVWIWWHGRELGLSVGCLLILALIARMVRAVTSKVRIVRARHMARTVRPADQQAPHFIIE